MSRLTRKNESICDYCEYERNNGCIKTDPAKCVFNRAWKELQHYKDLEEQGRLITLPCKVGDTVWEVQEIRERIQPMEIISVNIGRMGLLYFNWELKDGIGIYHNVKGFGASQIGKTVFLTKEEALQRLEELKNEQERRI